MIDGFITNDGLVALSRVFVSCRPVMGDILVKNQQYLIATAKSGRDVSLSEYLEKLPIPDPTYVLIMEYAEELGEPLIDAQIVYKFFGSEPHFIKIIGQLKEHPFKEDFLKKMLFAHMLIPVTLTSFKNGHFSGVYSNGHLTVGIKNLVSGDSRLKLTLDQKVPVHYATIIDDKIDPETEKFLYKTQGVKKEFIEACKYTGLIDYSKFWDLCNWTKGTLKERGLS